MQMEKLQNIIMFLIIGLKKSNIKTSTSIFGVYLQ